MENSNGFHQDDASLKIVFHFFHLSLWSELIEDSQSLLSVSTFILLLYVVLVEIYEENLASPICS